jgi:hypothetical protein
LRYQNLSGLWRVTTNFRKQSQSGVVCNSSSSLCNPRLNGLAEIDLSNTLPKLDATATELVAHQRDSLAQRKDLAQKTKDFRKLDDEGKLGEYKSLLKGTEELAAIIHTVRSC